jgi:hypothetical protein
MRVSIGDIIPSGALEGLGDRLSVAQHLRTLTYQAGGRSAPAQYGPLLSRRLGLDVPDEWALLSAPEKLKAAY